jgi:hypothetical protein
LYCEGKEIKELKMGWTYNANEENKLFKTIEETPRERIC